MAKVIDFSTYLDNTALQPEVLTGLVTRIAQGNMVAETVMPVEAVPSQDFGYQKELDYAQFGIPNQKGEKGGPTLVQAEFEKVFASTVKYYEGGELTEDYLRQKSYAWVDKVGEIMNRIARKIQLGVESDVLATLKGATGVQAQAATASWVNATAGKPLTDIINASQKIQLEEALDPDTLLLYVQDYNRLIMTDQIRATAQYIKGVNGGKSLFITDIANGISIKPMLARYNAAGTLTPLLSNSGILIPAGEVGKLYEFQGYTADRVEDKKNQLILLTGKRQVKAVVTNPARIAIITGI